MDFEVARHKNYQAHKFAAEEDFFYNILHFSGGSSASINQIGNTDFFYTPFYFSDGTLTDVNVYYVRSEKLRLAAKGTHVIRFTPGTGEWLPMKGDLKETHAWIFVCRISASTSNEIEEIFKLEENLNTRYINYLEKNFLNPKPSIIKPRIETD
jgi:hypothetical protein